MSLYKELAARMTVVYGVSGEEFCETLVGERPDGVNLLEVEESSRGGTVYALDNLEFLGEEIDYEIENRSDKAEEIFDKVADYCGAMKWVPPTRLFCEHSGSYLHPSPTYSARVLMMLALAAVDFDLCDNPDREILVIDRRLPGGDERKLATDMLLFHGEIRGHFGVKTKWVKFARSVEDLEAIKNVLSPYADKVINANKLLDKKRRVL